MSNLLCPSTDDLQAFLQGDLSIMRSEPLREHLESCQRCAELVRDLDELEDPFLAAVRNGQKLTVDVGNSPTGTGSQTPSFPKAPHHSPQSVPGYEVMEELGRGGMGVVYKARQIQLDRLVALKMILAAGHASAADLARFRIEGEAIARLQHPNIVQVFEIGDHGGLPFFSLEFCPGGSLEKELRGTPLPPRDAAVLVEQLARGMEAAHRKDVIHRDLKPANVLLAEDGRRKITDFGLAKMLNGEPGVFAAGATQTGAILGTPSYMAPEQADGKNKELGAACDIYALGSILYECLTGRPPFKAATPLDTLRQVVSEEPVPPRQLNRLVPVDLETICLKCLQKESARRFVTAADLADDLGRWQRGKSILARPVGRLVGGWRWCKRNPPLVAALGAVAAPLLLGTIVSTAFAIQADEARGVAEQHAEAEGEANKQAGIDRDVAVAARNELEEANDLLLSGAARTLVRPLGLQVQPREPVPPLSDAEIDTLWELGGTAEEKLRLRFVEEALRNPVTTRQLRNRAGFALHAAVGLDAGRREAVERLLVQHLSGKVISLEERTDLSLSLAALEEIGPKTASQAAAILIQVMNTTTDPIALRQLLEDLQLLSAHLEAREAAATRGQGALALSLAMNKLSSSNSPLMEHRPALRALSQSLSAVATRLEPKEAKEVAATLTQAMTKTTDGDALQSLSQGLSAVAARLEPKEAKEVAAALTQAMTKPTHPFTLWAFAQGLTAVAARLEPKEAKEAAAILTQAMTKTTDPTALKALAWVLSAVAARLEPKEAKEAVATLTLAMPKTTDPGALQTLAQGLAAVAARLEPKEAKEAAAILTQAMTETTNDQVLWTLAQGLTAVAARLEPKEAAATLTQVMTKTTPPGALKLLAEGLSAVAAGLEPKEAAATCSQAAATLNKAMTKTTPPGALKLLAMGLSAVAAGLEPKEAAATCSQAAATLNKAMTKTTDPWALLELAQGLTAVAVRLEPKEAAATCSQVAATLNQAMSKMPRFYNFHLLAQGLAALSVRLEPKEAAATCSQAAATLTRALTQTTNPSELMPLAQGLVAVTARLEPKEAAVVLTQAMSKISALNEPGNSLTLGVLSESLSALAARLEPKEAKEVAATLTLAMTKTKDPNVLQALAQGLLAVTARLDPKEAAATLTQAMSKTSDPYALLGLSGGVAALAARLEPKKAAATCGQAATTLTQTMSKTSDAYRSLIVLSQGVAALAAHLDPKVVKEAAATLTLAMSKISDPHALQELAQGLAALAARLDPKEAAATCGQAATTLAQAMSKTSDPHALQALSQGLAALPARLEPREAAATLPQTMSKTSDYLAFRMFPQGLAAVHFRESAVHRSQRLRILASSIGLQTSAVSLPLTLAAMFPALEPLPEAVSSQTLVEFLKHPRCVGAARRGVLDALGMRYQKTFTNQWDFVRFATENKLDLDFSSPPKGPEPAAVTGEPEGQPGQ